jgi:hypothetical protein
VFKESALRKKEHYGDGVGDGSVSTVRFSKNIFASLGRFAH